MKDLKFNVRVSGWNLESKAPAETANPETKTLHASSDFPADTPRHIRNAQEYEPTLDFTKKSTRL